MKLKLVFILVLLSLFSIILIGCPNTINEVQTYKDTDTNASFKGYINTAGLYIEGDNLMLSPYKMDLNGSFIESNTNTFIVNDLTTLTTNLWYAVTVEESNAVIGYSPVTQLNDWTGHDLNNNQLNMYAGCYDISRGYCYADGKRIIGVFKLNTGDNIIIDIKDIPKTKIELYMDAQFPIIQGNDTIIKFSKIKYDINSEYNLSTGITTLLHNQNIYMMSNIKNFTTGVTEHSVLSILFNSQVYSHKIFFIAAEAHANPFLSISNTKYLTKGSTLSTKFRNSGSDLTIDTIDISRCSITGY